MANLNYGDVFTTTLEDRTRHLADNVSKNNALLKRLHDKGKIRTISGGSKILEELEYGEGDLVWYSGYDNIDYAPKQLFTAAEFDLKLCAVPVAISGEDMLKNAGDEQIINLFEKRIDNAVKTMKNQMSKAIYGDGTGSSGKEIGGLQVLSAVSIVRLPVMNFGVIKRQKPLPLFLPIIFVPLWMRCISLYAAVPINPILSLPAINCILFTNSL